MKRICLCIVFFSSCTFPKSGEYRTLNELQKDLSNNYRQNSRIFDHFLDSFQAFRYIIEIEFNKENVNINYKMDKDSPFVELSTKSLYDPDVIRILQMEKISIQRADNLRNKLRKINCVSIKSAYSDKYNPVEYQIELGFTNWKNIYYYYRVYREDMDDETIDWFHKYLEPNNLGAILSKRVIWYTHAW